LEIIAIDDCSIDETWDKLKKIAEKDSRVIIHRNETNLKLIRTLNLGIDLAKGDYVARMDADDISNPFRIEKQLSVLKGNNSIDLVSVFPRMIDMDGKYHSKQKFFVSTSTGSAKFISLFQAPLLHAGILVKSSVLKENHLVNLPEYLHIEDYELWVRLLFKVGIKFQAIPEALYDYRINPQSVSYLFTKQQRFNHFTLSRKTILDILQYNIDPEILKIVLLQQNGDVESIKYYRRSIKNLKEIRRLYINKYVSELTKKEKREIYIWVQQRIIRISLFYLYKGGYKMKSAAIIKLIFEIDSLFYLITYKNIISRIEWTMNSGKIKVSK
jgi:glycosyltransferase involved in cell wall biosynthesis